jgi:3-isopropylmalate/(R)-2-methylmalate dehydratase large subunit
MLDSLLRREVRKLPDRVRLTGRILFLVDDAGLVRRQLAGEDLPSEAGLKLRDDISTDEITPAYICYYHDDRLGDFPYLGLRAGGEFPVTPGSVRQGGFVASVSGKRRGKGSSREQSPYAELVAGIRLVIAENHERIYRQNCQNLGVLTSTDFSLIGRIRRGEEIPLAEFTKGEDAITAQIIEYGGLFPFNVARLQGKVRIPPVATPARPMTLAEKILARHMVVDAASGRVGVPAVQPGDAGFVATDLRFSHEYVTPMSAIFFEKYVGADERVNDPGTILFFRDHLTFLDQAMTPERKAQGLLEVAQQLEVKQAAFAKKQGIRLHGELEGGGGRRGSEAICHSKVAESYALPGQVIIGSDSHTPHSGALGCVAFGVGTTDIFNSWITRDVRIRVPEQVLVRVRGKRPAGITAKDFMLALLRLDYVRSGGAIGKLIEYGGEAVRELSIDERATMTNMAAEVGAFTGIVAPDETTARFLVERRGMAPAEAERLCAGLASDPDASWSKVIEIDASDLSPMVALPGDPGNGVFLRELPQRVKVDIAYGGSCTAGKNEDMDLYARVFRDAVRRGRKVHPDVRCYIQFGSQETKHYAESRGYLDVFRQAGVQLIEPSCGACINAGPGVSQRSDEVTVSAINRNFPGRSGPGQMYLASPLTVAASAIEGYIAEFRPEDE